MRFLVAFVLLLSCARSEVLRGGWGVDAAVGCEILRGADLEAYRSLLESADMSWLRGRGFPVGQSPALPSAKGWFGRYQVAGFAGDSSLPVESGDQLSRDLLAVYRSARAQAESLRGRVKAWEMVGEPDVGYCRDLPDRVAAYQKAQYLGLRDGDPDAVVLMGALALPPGPWLARAARNRLFDYTDALNVHFYGNAGDLTGTLRAHALFAAGQGRGELPLWVTECGIEPVMPGERPDGERQRIHGDFMVSTAGQALAFGQVAVFMPFILKHEGDPNAMTLGASEPLPAWTRYAAFTRAHPWPAGRPVAKRPAHAGRLLVQWAPDNATCTPSKVSGAYRFIGNKVVRGVLRVYNLGTAAARARLVVSGRVVAGAGAGSLSQSRDLELAPMACVEEPLAVSCGEAGDRLELEARLLNEGGALADRAAFAVERPPVERTLARTGLALEPLPGRGQPQAPLLCVPMLEGGRSGVWTGLNGQSVEDLGSGRVRLGAPVGKPDRLRPPLVAAALHKLPHKGFLHVVLDRPSGPGSQVRVDLIDRDGQRFCIWENFGQDYGDSGRDLWLSLDDFHAHFFGRCRPSPGFHPERIVEIQLRPYLQEGSSPLVVQLEWAQP